MADTRWQILEDDRFELLVQNNVQAGAGYKFPTLSAPKKLKEVQV